jgi:hypothetical protein
MLFGSVKFSYRSAKRNQGFEVLLVIQPPTVCGRLESRAQTSLDFWDVTLDPSPHRDVIDVHAPLGQQLLHLAV